MFKGDSVILHFALLFVALVIVLFAACICLSYCERSSDEDGKNETGIEETTNAGAASDDYEYIETTIEETIIAVDSDEGYSISAETLYSSQTQNAVYLEIEVVNTRETGVIFSVTDCMVNNFMVDGGLIEIDGTGIESLVLSFDKSMLEVADIREIESIYLNYIVYDAESYWQIYDYVVSGGSASNMLTMLEYATLSDGETELKTSSSEDYTQNVSVDENTLIYSCDDGIRIYSKSYKDDGETVIALYLINDSGEGISVESDYICINDEHMLNEGISEDILKGACDIVMFKLNDDDYGGEIQTVTFIAAINGESTVFDIVF